MCSSRLRDRIPRGSEGKDGLSCIKKNFGHNRNFQIERPFTGKHLLLLNMLILPVIDKKTSTVANTEFQRRGSPTPEGAQSKIWHFFRKKLSCRDVGCPLLIRQCKIFHSFLTWCIAAWIYSSYKTKQDTTVTSKTCRLHHLFLFSLLL